MQHCPSNSRCPVQADTSKPRDDSVSCKQGRVCDPGLSALLCAIPCPADVLDLESEWGLRGLAVCSGFQVTDFVVGRFAEMLCTQGFFVHSWQLQETNMARPSSIPSAFLDVLLTSPPVDPAPYIHRASCLAARAPHPFVLFPFSLRHHLPGLLCVGCGWGLLCRGEQRRTKGR